MGKEKRPDREHVFAATPNLIAEQIKALESLFPEAVCEGKVDFEKLKATLGEEIEERRERYSFTWAGKQNAIRLLQTPSRATLIPAPEESVDFETTGNLFIEGDNLEVLKLLYKPYFGSVKMIYIDPPYNTGSDFVYPDNFADPLDSYLKLTGQKDSEGNLLTSNPETSGRYHSAWLSMMYPRLFLARQLLREDGVIFVSIDDHEVHNLRMLMNEVFGEENLVVNIAWQKKVSPSNDAKWFSDDHDYLLVYARSKQTWRPMRLQMNERQKGYYTNPDNDPRGCWNSATYTCNKTREQRPNLYYPLINPTTGEEVWPRETAVWAYSKELHKKHVEEKLLYWGKDGKARMPRLKTFLSNAGNVVPRSVWLYSEVGHTQEATKDYLNVFPEGGFETPKPLRLIKRMLQVATVRSSPDLILDFFAGSATTAQAVLDLNREDGGNRRFILVQLPEPTGRKDFPTIADIGKERIRRVIAKLKKEKAAQLPSGETEDLGFRVFKLAESHHKLWAGVEEKEPTGYGKEMDLFKDPLLPGWTPENLIWEVALKEGFGLNSTIEKLDKVKHGIFYRVTDPDKDQHFTLCLGETLNADDLKILNLSKEDLFICRDIALTDELAANVALQCRLKTI